MKSFTFRGKDYLIVWQHVTSRVLSDGRKVIVQHWDVDDRRPRWKQATPEITRVALQKLGESRAKELANRGSE